MDAAGRTLTIHRRPQSAWGPPLPPLPAFPSHSHIVLGLELELDRRSQSTHMTCHCCETHTWLAWMPPPRVSCGWVRVRNRIMMTRMHLPCCHVAYMYMYNMVCRAIDCTAGTLEAEAVGISRTSSRLWMKRMNGSSIRQPRPFTSFRMPQRPRLPPVWVTPMHQPLVSRRRVRPRRSTWRWSWRR